jgi:RNA recognition motif-containing protein
MTDTGIRLYDGRLCYPPRDDPNAREHRTADRRESDGAPSPSSFSYDPRNRVFVCNVPFQADEAAVYGVMRQFGRVVAVTIPRDAASGVSAGFAFVDFRTAQDALLARTAQPAELALNGRILRVGEPNRQFGVAPNVKPVYVHLRR